MGAENQLETLKAADYESVFRLLKAKPNEALGVPLESRSLQFAGRDPRDGSLGILDHDTDDGEEEDDGTVPFNTLDALEKRQRQYVGLRATMALLFATVASIQGTALYKAAITLDILMTQGLATAGVTMLTLWAASWAYDGHKNANKTYQKMQSRIKKNAEKKGKK